MAGAAVWAGAAVLVLAVLLFLQVPLWGVGPRCVKQIWTRIIRCWKRGDKRVWSWSEVEPGLYVGSLPRSPDDLRELQVAPHNLRAVVSLVEAWEMKVSTSDFAHLDIEWLHLPTPDYTAPRSRDVERAATFIDRQICRGRGVLVHCNAGRGRSVVAAIAYLLLKHKADGWDRYAALEAVQRVRKTAPLLQCCQTRPQWRAVCAFERLMRREGHVGCPYWIAGPPVPYHGTTALGTTAHSDGSIRDAAALTAAAAASPGAEAGAGLGVGPVCGRGAAGLQAPEAAVTRDEARGHAPADLGDEPGAPAARRGSMLLLLRPLPPSVTPREGRPPQLYPLPPLVVAHPPDEVGNGGEDVPMPSQSAEPSIPMTLQAAGKPAERDDGSLHHLVVDEQDVARASLSSIDLRASGAAVDAVMREARTAGGAGHVILPGTPQR